MHAFSPVPQATVNIDVSTSSQAVQVTTTPNISQVLVTNNGTATAWINFGGSTVAATLANSIPVGPGVAQVFTVAKSDTVIYVAAIAAGTTGKIYFTPGTGI